MHNAASMHYVVLLLFCLLWAKIHPFPGIKNMDTTLMESTSWSLLKAPRYVQIHLSWWSGQVEDASGKVPDIKVKTHLQLRKNWLFLHCRLPKPLEMTVSSSHKEDLLYFLACVVDTNIRQWQAVVPKSDCWVESIISHNNALFDSQKYIQKGPKNIDTLQHEKYMHKNFSTKFI